MANVRASGAQAMAMAIAMAYYCAASSFNSSMSTSTTMWHTTVLQAHDNQKRNGHVNKNKALTSPPGHPFPDSENSEPKNVSLHVSSSHWKLHLQILATPLFVFDKWSLSVLMLI